MLSKSSVLLVTAVAPIVWGTTYVVTAELLPPDRPLLAALLRALPAGLILLLFVRRRPRGSWWWKASVLGVLNIGFFFALLFIAAYRLPGGVAATIGAVQPLLVAVLASRWLGERLTLAKLVAGGAGILGVALLVLQAQARLDALGVAAGLAGTLSMGTGVVLAKKWGQPGSPLAMTSWQLVAGGLFLAPVALIVEGPPPAELTAANLGGYVYLGVVGTAIAYSLWFRGIRMLPVSSVAFLGLLSPVVATFVGWLMLEQTLTAGQVIGALIILATIVAVNVTWRRHRIATGSNAANELRAGPLAVSRR